ncbi:MAG: tRNA (guanosine(46)-N7)-methyltransferase TrmB [Bacillota bacterium]|nr:tRNA (guanosine(46)-N7)-methyltransferase TrmB [Bacillota bacterium]
MRMRKIKWAVDYLEHAKSLVQPEDHKGNWKSFLGCETLHVEIGCGKGNYSLGMSNIYPEHGFIAVEKNESAAGIAAKKYDDEEHGRLCLIHRDAANIEEWFAEKEVDIIHLNFSDPWPKKRYSKRRLSSATFLEQYKRILKDDGQIQMKTDNSSLIEYSLLEFLSHGFDLIEVSVDYRREEHKEDVLTEYEEKFVSLGQPIYRAVFAKKKEN